MKKRQAHILPRIEDVSGWILIGRDVDDEGHALGEDWHIAWLDVFGSKEAARAFAIENCWPAKSWRAVRGQLSVGHQ